MPWHDMSEGDALALVHQEERSAPIGNVASWHFSAVTCSVLGSFVPITDERPTRAWAMGSPLPVLRENVISCLHYRVAREPALGVVRLRRLVS
jgi:hypothetical protein